MYVNTRTGQVKFSKTETSCMTKAMDFYSQVAKYHPDADTQAIFEELFDDTQKALSALMPEELEE